MKKYPETHVYPRPTTPGSNRSAWLFSKEVQFTELLTTVREQHRTLGMLSVGCSIGAELDSALAAAHSASFEAIKAYGIDKDADAIHAAEQASYQTVFRRPPGFRHLQSKALHAAGFDVVAAPHGLDISSQALRMNSDALEFKTGDVTKEPLPFGGLNLIMCHNVLCCIGGKDNTVAVDRAVGTMADSLMPGGVLSLAMHPTALRPDPSQATSDYMTTHLRVSESLTGQGFQPVAFGSQEIPFAFQRPL